MEIKYTSLELSKKLADAGCDLKPARWYMERDDGFIELFNPTNPPTSNDAFKFFRAYDILNDICVKYGEDHFFSGTAEKKFKQMGLILYMLVSDKKQEAEDYIWEHCLFNK